MFELDHLGVAVTNLEDALAVWRTLGARLDTIEEVAEQQVRVAFLDTGDVATELLEPLSDDSPIAKFLAAGRRGVHHVAYRVNDVERVLADLRGRGLALIHEHSVPGSRGTRIAFIHPRATGGVLVELVEYPPAIQ
ncbi:MAG: methylmalonyl-CoA epimerase [Planctomycetota bacterium]